MAGLTGAQDLGQSAVLVVASGELHEDARLAADGPGIVTGRQQHHLVRAELVLTTVVHHNVQAPRGPADYGLGGAGVTLVVPREAAVGGEPGEGALDGPAPRDDRKLSFPR
jgi:hypothetical protein